MDSKGFLRERTVQQRNMPPQIGVWRFRSQSEPLCLAPVDEGFSLLSLAGASKRTERLSPAAVRPGFSLLSLAGASKRTERAFPAAARPRCLLRLFPRLPGADLRLSDAFFLLLLLLPSGLLQGALPEARKGWRGEPPLLGSRHAGSARRCRRPPPQAPRSTALRDAALRLRSKGRNATAGASSPASLSAPSSYSSRSGEVAGSGSERGSFQWSPSGRRTGSLYCRVGIGFHLQIHPDGQVNGSHQGSLLTEHQKARAKCILFKSKSLKELGGRMKPEQEEFPVRDIQGILEIFAVSQGIVGIRGVFSNKFLAMSKKGKLHASATFTEDCKFRERFQENSYNTYASAIHRTGKTGREWYVALNKRGKAKRGCSPRVKPQHISTHFLPRFRQTEQPELAFTVAVPEKKKPPVVIPPKPKVSLPVPRKNSPPVKYRLKFRFG
nr:PREDICTED: fibroblast growth factor 5 [Anolis carolinensis]|eukprot:XP_016852600.1 PREDICTED: fibroblast growth factor 5 [Anolis carolinensis]